MRKTIILLFILLGFQNLYAQDFHVEHYDISIDTIDFGNQSITAHVAVDVEATADNVNSIELSLLELQVDSIIANGQSLNFNYDDTTITITLNQSLNTGDNRVLTVYYHGQPQEDNSGFGGFSFSGSTYAFNIGVGFEANPHTYGRVWFPCVDTFTDRATYDFHIRTLDSHKAFCNGELINTEDNGDGTTTWHWKMNESIPTYLASMAVAPFYTIERNYHNIPVQLAVMASDTNNTMSTFQNLENCIGTFLNRFGPYQWNKIGYVAVPFNAGAMEHSTSIHIGKAYINGTLSYQTLWAHELAHQWWGDLVTCERQEEMWLNEGFASYSEALFLEGLHGTQKYRDYVRSNHRRVLQFAHIIDNGYRALNNIPHEYTYSTTVYDKGADIAHTIRGYMGDSAFFNGCQNYFSSLAYQDASSEDLRDALTTSSGINMNRFFEDWVFTPGFPHFSIDSFNVVPQLDNTYRIDIFTKQKQKGNSHIYELPMEFTFRDGVNDTTITLTMDAATNALQTAINFTPLMVTMDRDEKLSDAITDYEMWVKSTGMKDFKETNTRVNILDPGVDSSLLRIEHHWAAPDDFLSPPQENVRLSDYHYYTVDGIFSDGFRATVEFNYNGSTNQSYGHLDNNLITGSEDSLVLYYRENAGENWELYPYYELNVMGSPNNKAGRFHLDSLLKGEYAFGYGIYNVGTPEDVKKKNRLNIYPNPSGGKCTIEFDLQGSKNANLEIFDPAGKLVFSQKLQASQSRLVWDSDGFSGGVYLVVLRGRNGKINSSRFLKE